MQESTVHSIFYWHRKNLRKTQTCFCPFRFGLVWFYGISTICCILMKISITTIILIHIQILADFVVSDTNGLIKFWLRSFDMRKETQLLKAYANHTMLTQIPTRGASCGIWDLNSSLSVENRKSQPLPSTVDLNYVSFQNPQILRTISSGHDVIHTSAPFPVGGLLWQMMIPRRRKTAPSDYASEIRDPNSSEPYQTK